MRWRSGTAWVRRGFATAVCAAAIAGCGSSKPATPVLTIKSFAFSPQPLTLKVGQQLTIRNLDASLHGFATDDGSVVLGAVNPGGFRTATFAKPGRFSYHCTLHAAMKGTLIVR
jgi:plastocyanin